MRVASVCGFVFLEHGGGALLAFSSRQFALTINHGPSLCPLHTIFSFLSKRSGRRMPPAERIALYKHTWIFSERARLAPPWPLTSSHLNTASFYYLLDHSSFSLLSPLFCTTSVFSFFFVSLFPHFCSSVFVYIIRKASRQQLIRIFPKYTADTQPCDGPPSRLYHFYCGYRCD